MNDFTYNYVKESEFVSDTFAEHDTNEINEIRKSLKESLGVKSSDNGKSKERSLYPKNIIYSIMSELKFNFDLESY